MRVNYCNSDLSTTVFWPDGSKTTAPVAAARSPIDCFYVYPTVSLERRGNADLKIESTEKYTVLAQAARFSQVCRVFAPVYRQTTVTASAATQRLPIGTCSQRGVTTPHTGTTGAASC